MSFLNLKTIKTKSEPQYKKKIIDVVEKSSTLLSSPIKEVSSSSALLIGEMATINGIIKEKNEICIHGNVEGDIECRHLVIGKSGILKGKIKTDIVSVEGIIEGELEVKGLLKLMTSGTVSGKISYGSLEIHEGGKLFGDLTFKDNEILQEEFGDWQAI